MTVFVEPLGDIAGLADGREVVFETGVVRENHAGTGMVTPRRVSVRPVNGVLTTPSLDPGPARVCIAFEWFDIVIPDGSGPQRLWPLIEDSVPYEPPVVSLVKEYRDEMVSTKAAVETSLEHYGGVLSGLTDRAEDAAERAERAADRAEGAEGGGGPIADGSVTKPKLSQGVQDSLNKADSAVQGDDSRLTDARTPTTHTHTGDEVTAVLDTEDGPVEVDMNVVVSTMGAVVEMVREKASTDSPVFTGRVEMTDVKIAGGSPGVGKVLTSDGSGVGTWETPAGGGGIAWAVSNTSNLSSATPTVSSSNGGGMAIGYSAASGGFDRDIALGPRAQTGGQGSIAMGDNARATGNQSLSVGRAAQAPHGASSAFGTGATTTKTNQVILGTSAQTVTMPGKAEIGEGTAMVMLSTRITGGKAELVAQFATGSPIVIATQP